MGCVVRWRSHYAGGVCVVRCAHITLVGKKFVNIGRVKSTKEDVLSILALELTEGILLTCMKKIKYGYFQKIRTAASSNLRGGVALSYLSE